MACATKSAPKWCTRTTKRMGVPSISTQPPSDRQKGSKQEARRTLASRGAFTHAICFSCTKSLIIRSIIHKARATGVFVSWATARLQREYLLSDQIRDRPLRPNFSTEHRRARGMNHIRSKIIKPTERVPFSVCLSHLIKQIWQGSRMRCAHNEVSGVSLIECVQGRGWCSQSHLSAAVCTEVRGSTTGMQCPHTPVHPERRSRWLHTRREADHIEMSSHCCTNTALD